MDDKINAVLQMQKLFSYNNWSIDFFNKKYAEALKSCLVKKLDQQKPIEFLDTFLGWYKKMLQSVQHSQDTAASRFRKNNETSFKSYITENKAEKACAKSVDAKIKLMQNMNEQEIGELLDDLDLVLKLTVEKSLFEIHYKQYLRKRLMGPMTQDAFLYEVKVLDKLKLHLDYEQVEHMELAILEVKNSGALQSKLTFTKANFELYLQRNEDAQAVVTTQKIGKLEMDFKIVSFTFWQISSSAKTMLNLFPPQVNTMQGLFSSFYRAKFNERVLVWLYNIGNATLTMVTSSGKKELHMTKLQAFVCFMLNDRPKVTLEDIKNKSLLPLDEVLIEIIGLVCSDVLVVEDKSKKEVLQSGHLQLYDKIMINPNADKLRSHVKVKQMKPKQKEIPETNLDNQFVDFKKNVLESTIMKVMKSEKRVRFEDLMNKVQALVTSRFTLHRKELMEVLEGLINKEYLERDSYSPNIFLYSDSSLN